MEFLLVAIILGIVATGVGFLIGRQKSADDNYDLPADRLDKSLQANRMELNKALNDATDRIDKRFEVFQTLISNNLKDIREDNSKQLDRMRQTVDEKLQSTLDKRLTESFKRIDSQLETVNKNFGEMQALATNVGELQNTLSGVKTRGVWGEAHLEDLLNEVLNPGQYIKEFKPQVNKDIKVEFALKIPSDNQEILYLPIDAKLPLTRFEALQKAIESHDKGNIDKATKALHTEIKKQAKEINKYINPPVTTDFAIMYLPLESLYAEVIKNTDLIYDIRHNYQVAVASPNTLLPMLAMLKLGYRSLTIQKRVSEVWQILIATQAEFSKFGDLMDKAKKKLDEASNVIDSANTKTRTIEGKFKKVQKIDFDQS